MLRFAWGLVASAITLFGGAGVGILGAWGAPLGAVGLTVGAVVAVVAMEDRDGDPAEATLTR